jgi:hypothetical protein
MTIPHRLRITARLAGSLALGLTSVACTPRAAAVYKGDGRIQAQTVTGTGSGEQWLVGSSQDRLLVRRAELVIEVERPADVQPRATALASALGGYVQSATTAERGVHLVLRVPATSLDATLDSLGRLGHVESRTVSADDVTEQAIDLEARVTSLRAARDRLRELQGRAAAVAELVAAEGELARVQGELDSMEGRLKLLRSSVALAEVRLQARQRLVLGPLGILFAGLGRLVGKLFVIR